MDEDGLLRAAQVVRPAAGGIRRHVSLLAAHLDRQRFAPSIYAPADFTPDISLRDTPQFRVDIAAHTGLAADLRAVQDLTRKLRGNADLVHAHGLRAALIGVLAAQRAGIPSLFTAHNLLPYPGRLQRSLLRYLGRVTNGVVAVSQAVADTLVAAGLPAVKIHVIPNGIDLAPFDSLPVASAIVGASRPFSIPSDAPLVVGIGRLSPEKGFDVLIKAFAEVRRQKPPAHLLVVGSGPESKTLRALAVSTNLTDCIHFPGRLNDVVPILHTADIFAVPSRMEGQGIVALEAMAARKAVVAARVGGLRETIIENETGLFVPPDDAPALADALVQLLSDAPRCLTMGRHGRQRVEQLYTIERMILNIQNIYASLPKQQR